VHVWAEVERLQMQVQKVLADDVVAVAVVASAMASMLEVEAHLAVHVIWRVF
jgi:hypothetical protein